MLLVRMLLVRQVRTGTHFKLTHLRLSLVQSYGVGLNLLATSRSSTTSAFHTRHKYTHYAQAGFSWTLLLGESHLLPLQCRLQGTSSRDTVISVTCVVMCKNFVLQFNALLARRIQIVIGPKCKVSAELGQLGLPNH